MMAELNTSPLKVVEWSDDRTPAVGWIVVDRLVNGVCGGGLFMHSGATVTEVADLAATMSLKNTLVSPRFGGGKGGIRFDAKSPEAEGVLRRFMLDNRALIANQWSTGADLYTSNELIEKIAREDLGLPSAFAAIGAMIGRVRRIPSQADQIGHRMATRWDGYFSLEECATGYSVAHAVEVVASTRPRVAIQGFGHVGSSAAYFLHTLDIADVVGICEKDGFIIRQTGLDIGRLIRRIKGASNGPSPDLHKVFVEDGRGEYAWHPRKPHQSDEDLFVDFVREARPTILSPCAARYAVTETVLDTILESGTRHIVSGANNVFASPAIADSAEREGLTILPEWVSNSGNAILFAELLGRDGWSDSSGKTIFATIKRCIADFINSARSTNLSLRAGCHTVAEGILADA
jgi:glutamate dehydrogenase (NAD(P)+)